ncbi:cupredoxin domain-containing protein [Thalassomonas sp. RHCl1]|uniref:cupredoxin domain-containing protein n=1 Tax=Thalassomonas sp. RHCl1 TaxID=2995320 RepID=UPI00248D1332|nr:cupredoxin domain-containing protein [Thalassomonas sp. RHCl1]
MDKYIKGILLLTTLCWSCVSWGKRPEYKLELKDHLFYPAEIEIPAGRKVKLVIHNHDSTPEEFDSFDLNREKVIFPKKKAVIFVGPLPPGRYGFFGEYNPNTATGTVVVTDTPGDDNRDSNAH